MPPFTQQEQAIRCISEQLQALEDILREAKDSGNTTLAFEKMRRWKHFTVEILAKHVSLEESTKLDRRTPSPILRGRPIRNLFIQAKNYRAFLEALAKEIQQHPDYVFDGSAESKPRVSAHGSSSRGSQAGFPLEVFYSYSHEDETLRDELAKHLSLLEREGIVHSWHDRKIGAGKELGEEIDAHLEGADLILLLVSPDFMASEYCYGKEVKRAMARHEAGAARVIPIILRPFD